MINNFHLMAKPASSKCNLKCEYCFYLEKGKMHNFESQRAMSQEVLELYIKKYIHSQDTNTIEFAWQGGEPTMCGIRFFEDVLLLQKKYADGKKITNTLQTNGMLLNESWVEFLARNDFLVGISIDGDASIHDRCRVTTSGKGSFNKVYNAISLLNKYNVAYNTLTVVNRYNQNHGADVFNFLKHSGSKYHQYIPVVEFISMDVERGYLCADADKPLAHTYSVTREGYGDFMIDVFNEWIKEDVGSVFVQTFDASLFSWYSNESSMCIFNKTCGQSLIIEQNGDIYSCDHFVYPHYKLGNIRQGMLWNIANSEQQKRFSNEKGNFSELCRACKYLFACNGGCPKYRIDRFSGKPHNYLCASYMKYFSYIDKSMTYMTEELKKGKDVSGVMKWFKMQP
ncbi:anaerobic sulfatase maturase [Escherichia coli]|nr:anaerobic sulfatase maturase [Escherichia coli]